MSSRELGDPMGIRLRVVSEPRVTPGLFVVDAVALIAASSRTVSPGFMSDDPRGSRVPWRRGRYRRTRSAVSHVPHPASEVTPSHLPGNAVTCPVRYPTRRHHETPSASRRLRCRFQNQPPRTIPPGMADLGPARPPARRDVPVRLGRANQQQAHRRTRSSAPLVPASMRHGPWQSPPSTLASDALTSPQSGRPG